MIGKGKSISYTTASMEYGWNQEKDANVVHREFMAGDTPQELAKEFKLIQGTNHNCTNNTMSFILSPTIEDGKNLKNKDLGSIAKNFLEQMKITNRQAVAFVHRDKAHIHIHLYVNRIDFNGKAFPDSFLGKRSQLAAEMVAKKMKLKTVKQVRDEKLNPLKYIRAEIQGIHEHVLKTQKPKSFNEYIKHMAAKNVQVLPSINKAGRLQGFRFKYKGVNLKGSDVHRSMSGGKIGANLATNSPTLSLTKGKDVVNILGKSVQLTANLVLGIGKAVAEKTVKKVIDNGIEMGF